MKHIPCKELLRVCLVVILESVFNFSNTLKFLSLSIKDARNTS